MSRFHCALAFLIFLLAGCSSALPVRSRGAVPAAEPAEAPFPIPVVDLRGSSTMLGQEQAALLGGPIRMLFERYLGRYFSNSLERTIALTAAGMFERHILPEHRIEIEALSRGLHMDEREVMLGQCFLDLSAMTACSTITFPADAAPDHIARFGRNLDFTSFDVADKQTVVLVYHPQGRYAFASIAWPGMIGVLSGMNEHGLALANMEVDRSARIPVAMPYTLLYRMILERCKTVDEAIALLRATARQTANNLMLMDASGGRAVAEVTPEKVIVRRAGDDRALISTNLQRGEDADTPGLCERYDYLHNASAQSFGRTGVRRIESMLNFVAQGKRTIQSMIFEPSTRTIYLAVGANAPAHDYYRLDLQPLLRKSDGTLSLSGSTGGRQAD